MELLILFFVVTFLFFLFYKPRNANKNEDPNPKSELDRKLQRGREVLEQKRREDALRDLENMTADELTDEELLERDNKLEEQRRLVEEGRAVLAQMRIEHLTRDIELKESTGALTDQELLEKRKELEAQKIFVSENLKKTKERREEQKRQSRESALNRREEQKRQSRESALNRREEQKRQSRESALEIERERQKKKEDQKRRSREKQQEVKRRKEEQLNDEILAAVGKKLLTLSESVGAAQKVLLDTNQESLAENVEFLDGSGETRNFLIDFNENLQPHYESTIRSLYRSRKLEFNHPDIMEAHLRADIAKCMELGLNKLMKTFDDSSYPSAKNETTGKHTPSGIKKKEIEKTHSWDELKDKF
jgi:hypothetical protein